eukprot:gb/GECH01008336.1/.p1 GENE.gb/GECH01008336.1/~~gb/GECH01008336.1/.p1  ORF type:complete len:901 (+),score=194.27 gb/GECH01008336.1/:1-2703(+)
MVIIEQPLWVYHGGYNSNTPILSVDTHVDGTRFVTGGGDSSIKIWKLSTLLSGKDDEFSHDKKESKSNTSSSKETQPTDSKSSGASVEKETHSHKEEQKSQLLAVLQRHDRCVNCVRFSPDGRYLAAGSDDATVSIHELVSNSTSNLGTFSNKEDWRCLKLFRDHSLDVLGVAWAPDSNRLASCSVDNKVIVFDVSTQSKIVELNGHFSLVKGVQWDPIGRYLISQTFTEIIVWKTNDWSIHKRIESPFRAGIAESLFLRSDWAPDGSSLLAVNGLKGGNYVGTILNREDFQCKYEIAGHKGPMVSCRFNSRVFENPGTGDPYVSYYATGGMDNALTIWSTALDKPFGRLLHLFKSGVIDIAWTRDGMGLLCCSQQGMITFVNFTEEELGKPISEHVVQQKLRKVYGKSSWDNTDMMETPDSLELQGNIQLSSEMMKESNSLSQQPQEETVTLLQPRSKRKKKRKKLSRPEISQKQETINKPKPFTNGPSIFDSRSKSTSSEQTAVAMETDLPQQPPNSTTRVNTSINSLEDPFNPPEEKPTTNYHPPQALRTSAPTSAPHVQSQPQNAPVSAAQNGFKRTRRVYGEESRLYLLTGLSIEVISDRNELRVLDKNDRLLWNRYLEGSGKFDHNERYVFVSSGTSLDVHTLQGRKIFPPIALDSKAKFLRCNDTSHVLVMTENYKVWVWDILHKQVLVNTTVDSLLETEEHALSVDNVALTDRGIAIVARSDGSSFMYHSGMQTWMCIADSKTPLSPFLAASTSAYEWEEKPIVSELRARAANPTQLTQTQTQMRLMQTTEDLEVALCAAELLESTKEYKRFAALYIRHLASCGEQGRMRDYFNYLLGPMNVSQSTAWHQWIGTAKKSDILRELLAVGIEERAVQRIIAEFKQKLDSLHRIQ